MHVFDVCVFDVYAPVYCVCVGAAALEEKLRVGMRVLAMNGKNSKSATKDECVESLRECLTAIMTLQFDPVGFSSIDGYRCCARVCVSVT